MATLHIKGQVCQYVYTGTANCASIPFIGIAVPLNLYGIMQQYAFKVNLLFTNYAETFLKISHFLCVRMP